MIAIALNLITILFNILGFIALTLLFLLLFALVLTLFVLILPFSYKCEGSYSNSNLTGYARVSWLFGFISITGDSSNTLTVRLLGIRVWRYTETPRDNTASKTKYTSTSLPISKVLENPTNTAGASPHPTKPRPTKKSFHNNSDKHKEQQDSEPKKSLKARFTETIDKVKDIWGKFQYYKNHPDRNEIISQAKLLIKRIIMAVMPKQLELSGSYGFEDPSQTGFATGGISIVSQLVHPRIRIHAKPDFTQQVIDLNLLVKGKIIVITILVPVFRFLFCKPVWRLIQPLIFPKKKRKPNHSIRPQTTVR